MFWSFGPSLLFLIFLSWSFGPGFFCLVIFVLVSWSWFFLSCSFCPVFVLTFVSWYFCSSLYALLFLSLSPCLGHFALVFSLNFFVLVFFMYFLSCLLSRAFFPGFSSGLFVLLSVLAFLCPGLIVLFLVYSICRICLCPGIFSCSFCPGFLSCSFGPVIIAQAFCPVHLDLLLLARSFSLFWSFCPVQIYLYPVRRCRGRTGGTKSWGWSSWTNRPPNRPTQPYLTSSSVLSPKKFRKRDYRVLRIPKTKQKKAKA